MTQRERLFLVAAIADRLAEDSCDCLHREEFQELDRQIAENLSYDNQQALIEGLVEQFRRE